MCIRDGMRAFAGPEAFDAVWQSLTGWESATFIALCGGSVLEIKGCLLYTSRCV